MCIQENWWNLIKRHLLLCYASARAAARGNVLANQEELRGSEIIGLTRESTSEIVVEDMSMIRRRSPIQVWQSWSQRVRQRYNAALQQWPVVRKLTYLEVWCNIQANRGAFSMSLVLEVQRVWGNALFYVLVWIWSGRWLKGFCILIRRFFRPWKKHFCLFWEPTSCSFTLKVPYNFAFLAMPLIFMLDYWVYIMLLMSILQTWAAGRISAIIKQLAILKAHTWWQANIGVRALVDIVRYWTEIIFYWISYLGRQVLLFTWSRHLTLFILVEMQGFTTTWRNVLLVYAIYSWVNLLNRGQG